MSSDTKATDRTVLMEQPTPTAPAKPPARGGRAKRWLIALASGSAVLGAAYGTGRFQTSSRVDEAQAIASAKAEQWTSEHASVLRLEARRKLHLALTALDSRNFGIGQEQLAAAATLLAATHPEGELDKLQKQIASYQLKASENVGAERDAINDWIKRFDEAVPAAKP
jgi:hypothetical protein